MTLFSLPANRTEIRRVGKTGAGCHLQHQVDGASVGRDGHSAPLWNRLVGGERSDGLRVSQGLDRQTVLLHQGRGGSVDTLEITFAKETF